MSATQGQKCQNEDADGEQQVKRVRHDYGYNDLIKVLVGTDEDEHEFEVQKISICEKPKFFEAAVSSDRWKEGQDNVVRLPEVDPDEFRAYIHWAYTGKFLPEIQ